jgi:hypothetical protein
MTTIANWSNIKPWNFSWIDEQNVVVKIQAAVEQPTCRDVQKDGWVTSSTLYNDNKLVGYKFHMAPVKVGEEQYPAVRTFSSFSMAASYSTTEPDNELVLVLGSPHVRLIRLGKPENAIYQLVMRRR